MIRSKNPARIITCIIALSFLSGCQTSSVASNPLEACDRTLDEEIKDLTHDVKSLVYRWISDKLRQAFFSSGEIKLMTADIHEAKVKPYVESYAQCYALVKDKLMPKHIRERILYFYAPSYSKACKLTITTDLSPSVGSEKNQDIVTGSYAVVKDGFFKVQDKDDKSDTFCIRNVPADPAKHGHIVLKNVEVSSTCTLGEHERIVLFASAGDDYWITGSVVDVFTGVKNGPVPIYSTQVPFVTIGTANDEKNYKLIASIVPDLAFDPKFMDGEELSKTKLFDKPPVLVKKGSSAYKEIQKTNLKQVAAPPAGSFMPACVEAYDRRNDGGVKN